MKKTWFKIAALSLGLALVAPVSLMAQKEEKDKEVKEKEAKEKKDVQQIIITRKNDSGEKMVIEVNGDKVTVNGKPIEELKDNGDITVRTHKYKTLDGLQRIPGVTGWSGSGNWNDNFNFVTEDANRAMLG